MTDDLDRPLPKKALNLFTIAEVLLVVAVLVCAAFGWGWLVLLTGWALLNVAFVRARVLRVYRRDLIDAANAGKKVRP
ncbi:hypothetical protein [Rhodococcus sp. RDE2]|uniref:hypothetical protein n=1 Tax=Rhodococcus sp. RDE2 TaxID=2885078 RepID=UPI001E2E115A|nr:hypothetical protein [Rhodococcus sp. RDE2]BDB62389.1 hypothetical protein RDE2_41830 [Rhodococcus sp. RDE2]